MATFYTHSRSSLVDNRRAFANTWYDTIDAIFSIAGSDDFSSMESFLTGFIAMGLVLNFVHIEIIALKFIQDSYLDHQGLRAWWPILLRVLASLVITSVALTIYSDQETLLLKAVDLYIRFGPAAFTYVKLIGYSALEYIFVGGGMLLYHGLPAWPPARLDRDDIHASLYRAFAIVIFTQDHSTSFLSRLGVAVNGYLMLQACITIVGCAILIMACVVALLTGIGKAVGADLYWPEGLNKRDTQNDGIGNAASPASS
ncbi:hypothetical protein LTR56_023255 [Elasticomyces elasticus]|nr:hypothetical protein LTR56_023255 [Elasticomyces elasticus]KAK3624183.1 hypothetical protein LTR22_024089 [Elasticomyces elasticus]KAK4906389.1 hypothetical protein LTR49_024471 [Elasticomyces elasticus]KAK5744654.1 hypothetical protein LTS12_023430 [Elasticomyces elasticus]